MSTLTHAKCKQTCQMFDALTNTKTTNDTGRTSTAHFLLSRAHFFYFLEHIFLLSGAHFSTFQSTFFYFSEHIFLLSRAHFILFNFIRYEATKAWLDYVLRNCVQGVEKVVFCYSKQVRLGSVLIHGIVYRVLRMCQIFISSRLG